MGAIFATTVTAGGASLSYGVSRLLAGLAFSLGPILVVLAGAELFTGNNLIVMAWASRKVSTARLVRNCAIVYAGNLVDALGTAGILFVGRQYTFGKGAGGEQARSIATAKTGLGFVQAIALGAFCNALVCLAIWLTYSARSTADKILAIVPPTWGRFLGANLLPVTVGNVLGGAVMVGAIYWFVYLRDKEQSDVDTGGNQRVRPRRASSLPRGVRA
jgi:formate transporter